MNCLKIKMLTTLSLFSLLAICLTTFTAKGEEWGEHSAQTYIDDYHMIKQNISELSPGLTIYGASRYYKKAGASIYIRNFTSWVASKYAQIYKQIPIKTGGLAGLLTSSLEGFARGKEQMRKDTKITDYSSEDESKKNDAQAVNLDRWMEPVHPVLIPNYYAVHHMTLRKWGLFHHSLMYILCPGGLGTMDEFFDSWNRVLLEEEIGRPKDLPSLILIGSGFWKPILRFLKNISHTPEYYGLIPNEAFKQIKLVPINEDKTLSDQQEKEFVDIINSHTIRFRDSNTEVIDSETAVLEDLNEIENAGNEVTISGGKNLNPQNHSVQIIKQILQRESHSRIPNSFRLTSSPDAIWTNELTQGLPRMLRQVTPHSSFMRTESVLQKVTANIFLPGDIATFTQLASILDQVQLGLVPERPIILVGRDFWYPVYNALSPLFMHKSNLFHLITITDDPALVKHLIEREK